MSGGGTTTTRLLTKERGKEPDSVEPRDRARKTDRQTARRAGQSWFSPREASCQPKKRPGDLLIAGTRLACVQRFQALLKPSRGDTFHLSQRERRMRKAGKLGPSRRLGTHKRATRSRLPPLLAAAAAWVDVMTGRLASPGKTWPSRNVAHILRVAT